MNFNLKIDEKFVCSISITIHLVFDFSIGSCLSLLSSEQTVNSISNGESL